MSPIVIEMYVAQNAGNASAPTLPGGSNLQLRSAPGSNAALFADPTGGTAVLSLQNLLATIASQLTPGQAVTLTIATA